MNHFNMANKSKKAANKSAVNKVAANMANTKTACEEGLSGNLKKKKNVTLSRKQKGTKNNANLAGIILAMSTI